MSVRFDHSTPSHINQSRTQSERTPSTQGSAPGAVEVQRDVYNAQSSAILTLVRGAALTYTRSGALSNSNTQGRHVEAIA